VPAAVGAFVALVAVVCAIVRWRPFRVEVRGPSMAPTLRDGDWALAVAPGRVRRGDVVMLEHPVHPGVELVKRVRGVEGDLAPDGGVLGAGEVWVEGDRPERSSDSRAFGPVRIERVKARVALVYWPPPRRRLIRRAR
jgi:signal peptidase I